MTDQVPPPPPPPAGPPPGYPPPPPPQAWGAPPPSSPQPSASGRRGVLIGAGAGVIVAAVVAVIIVVVANHGSSPAGSNGESQKTASTIATDASNALDSAASFHLTGTGSTAGETDVYDLTISTAGTQGSIEANGTHADILVINEDAYMRGQAFFTKFAGAQAGSVIGDRWVHVKTTDATYGKYLQFMTLSGLRTTLDNVAKDATFSKGSPAHVGGALATPLHAVDGELDVALDGKPYPLRLQFKSDANSADLHFSRYDAAAPQPTTPSDVLNPSS